METQRSILPADHRPLQEPRAEYDADGVDLTLLRWMVSLTPTERLAVLQRNVAALRSLLDARQRG